MKNSGPRYDTDILVIGSGIAGLYFALYAARYARVAIVTKKTSSDAATNYAQGGIAAVIDPEDTFALHLDDTLTAGAGLCSREAVDVLVEEGPERVRDLFSLGFPFSSDSAGHLKLGREGGHSRNRIVFAGDYTGRMVEEELLKKVRAHESITIFEYHHVVDLITSWHEGHNTPENEVLGAWVYSTEDDRVAPFIARTTFLACGGAGQVYRYTTNPLIATGDGVAMGYRAGCRVSNLEFYQFHPTALYSSRNEERVFLISEAVRGEGGRLLNLDGHAFMPDYDQRGDLAPRDIVARSIDAEMKKSGSDHVWLDVTGLPADEIKERFPQIYGTCLERFGLDITREKIPVVPAAHYMNGGVVTDLYGQTDLKNLFASGETTMTGVHGANRLASNSLLEGLVFSWRAAKRVGELLQSSEGGLVEHTPAWRDTTHETIGDLKLYEINRSEIRDIMSSYVGIVRSDLQLRRALRKIDVIYGEVRDLYQNNRLSSQVIELRNLALVAQLIIRSALMRRESRGLHFSTDFPGQLPVAENTTLQNTRAAKRPGTGSQQ